MMKGSIVYEFLAFARVKRLYFKGHLLVLSHLIPVLSHLIHPLQSCFIKLRHHLNQ